jgi:hypothetical protein
MRLLDPENTDCRERTVERVGYQRQQFTLTCNFQNTAGVAFNRDDMYLIQVTHTVYTATGYGLGIESSRGWGFRAGQTGPEAHPVSCKTSTESYQGVKRPGRGVDHPPPSTAGLRIDWFYNSAAPLWLRRHVMKWPLYIYIWLLPNTELIIYYL